MSPSDTIEFVTFELSVLEVKFLSCYFTFEFKHLFALTLTLCF